MQHFYHFTHTILEPALRLLQWYCFQRDFSHCKAEALRLLSYYPSFRPTQQLYLQTNEALRRTQKSRLLAALNTTTVMDLSCLRLS